MDVSFPQCFGKSYLGFPTALYNGQLFTRLVKCVTDVKSVRLLNNLI